MVKPIVKKRIAQWHDLDAILELLDSVGVSGEREKVLSRMKNIFYNPHFTNLVFEVKKEIVGFMTLEKSLTIDITATYLRIVVMSVHKDFMGLGKEKKMIDEAEKIAKEQETAGIFFLVNDKNGLLGVNPFLEKIDYKKTFSGYIKNI